jgi:hypothetical protein
MNSCFTNEPFSPWVLLLHLDRTRILRLVHRRASDASPYYVILRFPLHNLLFTCKHAQRPGVCDGHATRTDGRSKYIDSSSLFTSTASNASSSATSTFVMNLRRASLSHHVASRRTRVRQESSSASWSVSRCKEGLSGSICKKPKP